MIKFLFKLFVAACVLFVCYVALEVLLDDTEVTTEEYVSNDDNDGGDRKRRREKPVVVSNDDEEDAEEEEEEEQVEEPVNVKKSVKALTDATFKSKVAANKSAKAIVLVYSEKYEKSVTMLSYLKEATSANSDFDYYSLELSNAENVVSSYQLTEVPVMIIANHGKITKKVGTLSKESLEEYLESLD